MQRRSKWIPAMWPTCLIRRKQPSSSKRLRPLRQPIASWSRNHVHRKRSRMNGRRRTQMNDRIDIQGRDGKFYGHIARPKTSPAAAIVVLQELFGVNTDIRKTCDELAEQGFVAVAPDLF